MQQGAKVWGRAMPASSHRAAVQEAVDSLSSASCRLADMARACLLWGCSEVCQFANSRLVSMADCSLASIAAWRASPVLAFPIIAWRAWPVVAWQAWPLGDVCSLASRRLASIADCRFLLIASCIAFSTWLHQAPPTFAKLHQAPAYRLLHIESASCFPPGSSRLYQHPSCSCVSLLA